MVPICIFGNVHMKQVKPLILHVHLFISLPSLTRSTYACRYQQEPVNKLELFIGTDNVVQSQGLLFPLQGRQLEFCLT